MEPDSVIVIRGIECFELVPKARLALDKLKSGQILRVVTDDCGSVLDFEAFCKHTGAQIVSQIQHEDDHIYLIKKW